MLAYNDELLSSARCRVDVHARQVERVSKAVHVFDAIDDPAMKEMTDSLTICADNARILIHSPSVVSEEEPSQCCEDRQTPHKYSCLANIHFTIDFIYQSIFM